MSDESGGHSDHYFTPKADAGDRRDRRTIRVRLGERNVEVETSAGVFSRTRLDLGTQVLFRKVPPLPDGAEHLLDLGCGWGPVALTMAMQAPQAQVWAVDVNNLALDLTRANAERLGVSNVRAVLPDEVPADIRFDAIWSNPPIRVGRTELDAMLLRWLPRLAPGASGHLVVQHNLGADSLLRWLSTQLPVESPGMTARKLGSAKGYRVVEVTAPETRSISPE